MNDRIQLFNPAIVEGNLRQRCPIQPPVGLHNTVAKVIDDCGINGLPGLHQLAPDHVGLQHMRTKGCK